jgi:hypothetical protein
MASLRRGCTKPLFVDFPQFVFAKEEVVIKGKINKRIPVELGLDREYADLTGVQCARNLCLVAKLPLIRIALAGYDVPVSDGSSIPETSSRNSHQAISASSAAGRCAASTTYRRSQQERR